MAIPVGIIHSDLNGGDAAWTFVDEERWKQIKDLPDAEGEEACYRWVDIVSWLSGDDPEVYQYPDFPDRKGRVLHTIYTQAPGIEDPPEFLGNALLILGIITLPAG